MTSTQPPLLAIEELHAAYGLSRVLFGISLQVDAGECVCLLGRNGVGKTTTMRSVMGFLPPTGGRILWKGTNIAGWSPHRVARAGIGFVPEDRRIFAELTVWENLDVATRAARRGRQLDDRGGLQALSGIARAERPAAAAFYPAANNRC